MALPAEPLDWYRTQITEMRRQLHAGAFDRKWSSTLLVMGEVFDPLGRAQSDVVDYSRAEHVYLSGGGAWSDVRTPLEELLDRYEELIDQHARQASGVGLTAVELQRIEVVLAATVEHIHTTKLDVETEATLQAAIDTLRAQTASPRPDRGIIARALGSIATFTRGVIIGGAVGGLAGNYLTDLLRAFHVPWPQ